MLNVAAACNFWPLAAKASQLSFTNKLVDEATAESGADEEFPGFHDNAGLMLIFFLQQLHRPGRRIMIIQAWQRPDLSKERSSPRLLLRENRGPPPETIQGCSRIQGQWCRRLRLSARQGQPGRSRPLARRERSAAARAASGRRGG